MSWSTGTPLRFARRVWWAPQSYVALLLKKRKNTTESEKKQRWVIKASNSPVPLQTSRDSKLPETHVLYVYKHISNYGGRYWIIHTINFQLKLNTILGLHYSCQQHHITDDQQLRRTFIIDTLKSCKDQINCIAINTILWPKDKKLQPCEKWQTRNGSKMLHSYLASCKSPMKYVMV